MRWFVLLILLWVQPLYATDTYEGKVQWRSWLPNNITKEGIAQLIYHDHSGVNNNDNSFALSLSYANTSKKINASVSPSMLSMQPFTIFNTQGKIIGKGRCVFDENFNDYWADQDYWYPDGGTTCTLNITDDTMGNIELIKGFSEEHGLQFIEGSITVGEHKLFWWHNNEGFWPLARVAEILTYKGTSYWQDSRRRVLHITYTRRTLNTLFDLVHDFTLTLSDATGTRYIRAVEEKLSGSLYILDADTAERVGEGGCHRIAASKKVCELQFSIKGFKQVKLTKVFDPWEVTTITGTITPRTRTRSWEAATLTKVSEVY